MRTVCSLLATLLVLISDFASSQNRRFFLEPSLSLKIEYENQIKIDLEAGSDHLIQYMSAENYPMMYARNFRTEVCYDNQCRLLNVNLYWNPTGRYLGFELPEREFLSKAEHEKFTMEEYNRLNGILADQFSPLGAIAYEVLVPKRDTLDLQVDAVTSATAKNLLDYVVEGAAFTTYKMWHFVYGETQKKVIGLTEEKLTSQLILKLLESPDSNDKIWALNHIEGFVEMTPDLRERLMTLISGKSYSYAERAINALNPTEMSRVETQVLLAQSFVNADYSIRKLLISKLMGVALLSNQASDILVVNLSTYSGEIIRELLGLLKKNKHYPLTVIKEVAPILKSENSFISKQAYNFLKNIPIEDPEIKKQVENYTTQ